MKNNFLAILLVAFGYASKADEANFDQNYNATWGFNHVTIRYRGREARLLTDESSGSGFSSKLNYGSGYFRMRTKIPNKNTKGVLTTFYLTSVTVSQSASTNHNELDCEFFGNNNGMPYTLNTNVFANDTGSREQQFCLWFDPTADFHTYEILWNQHQIVFFVDQIPVRVFKNHTNLGVYYPSQSMHIECSVWNSTAWLGEVNWSQAPFAALYRGFDIHGCPYQNSSNPKQQYYCYSSNFPWNREEYWQLNPDQQTRYEDVRERYMTYDYCTSSDPSKNHPECHSNRYKH